MHPSTVQLFTIQLVSCKSFFSWHDREIGKFMYIKSSLLITHTIHNSQHKYLWLTVQCGGAKPSLTHCSSMFTQNPIIALQRFSKQQKWTFYSYFQLPTTTMMTCWRLKLKLLQNLHNLCIMISLLFYLSHFNVN